MILLILWMIAGFIIGGTSIDLIARLVGWSTLPSMYNFGFGFVGALVTYTIMRGL